MIAIEHTHSHEETSPKTKRNQAVTSSSPMPISNSADGMSVSEEQSRPHGDSFTDLYGHPAATRASVVQAAHDIGYGKSASPRGLISIDYDDSASSTLIHEQVRGGDENHERLLQRPRNDLIDITEGSSTETQYDHEPQHLDHGQNSHEHHRVPNAHTGSHGSMNMHALILHVVGDALANVGVIATGLVIWLSTWEYKYYFDPIISLVITVIIFSSALPLGLSF